MSLLSLLLRTRSGSGSDLTFYAFIGVFVGLGAFYHGFKQWSKFKKVADTPTSKVRSMPAGLVELNGKVVVIKTLSSPVSRASCVYYKVEHQTYVRSKNGGNWITTSVDNGFENFYLQDDTGKVEIDPRKADIDIPSDKTQYYGLSNKRDIEYFLSPGDLCYALGTAKNKPGIKSAKNEENFIVTQGEGDKTFYITDKKEQDVQKSLSGNAKWGIVGGIIITVLSVGYLVFKLMT